jgi:uncharacterized protein YjiS (DUF1127 family)
MTRESSHEFSISHYARAAHDERAEALTRFGYLAISGADRAIRQTLAALWAGVSSLVARWQSYTERRATYLALAKLDDRMLKDIGLTRADIEGGPNDLPDRPANDAEAAVVPAPRPTATVHEFKRAA